MANDSRTLAMFSLVEQWQQSGISQKQFSAEYNIKLATFSYWVKRFRLSRQGEAGFARVELGLARHSSDGARVEIDLGDGLVIRIF